MIAIRENNKVFELIDYLFENIEKIKTYQKLMEKYDTLNNEVDYLKPKNLLLDDTEYQKKKKEFDEFCISWKKIIKPYSNKIDSFEIIDKYDRGLFKNDLENILTTWIKNITENGSAENKRDALKEIRVYRDKFKALQTDLITKFMFHVGYSILFSDLECILIGNSFDGIGFFNQYIQPKYSGLSKALEPYLEGATDDVIESIIDEHKLPQGADKPKWKRNADGARFGKYVGLENRQLRELFNNDIRTNNIPPDANRNNEIRNILLRYKVPQAKQE